MKAKLKIPVRRSPRSLAGMYYHLAAGTIVTILSTEENGRKLVTTHHEPTGRIFSEDCFTVSPGILEEVAP